MLHGFFFWTQNHRPPLQVEQKLEQVVCKWIREKEYVEFLVGRNGEFDQMAASTIRRCKRMAWDDNNALVCVLPYETAEFRNNKQAFEAYYDAVEICDSSAEVYFKSALQERNKSMINRSDAVVFCVQHTCGRAWQSMKYAKKLGKPYVNMTGDSIMNAD